MRYRSKVVEIEAIQLPVKQALAWLADAIDAGSVWLYSDGSADIRTLEGVMRANLGDWIIRGTEGELYPCKPSVFERKYELIRL